ncbi:hypothetical protein KM546_gp29 [Porcine lymphotropic herpesvirus 3]|uniref:Uncharacterized protein n=1 Tax=Suid gammaherpesvirus 5 TaxID=1960251 RepID=Q8B3Y9_9GAMA|nr:hypothetical protein KM546_gp29 [Porcine lymphotropic herpesvirus 3]AAO12335.1 unknown [Porcine lymphotropic herpesvirus 3]
MAAKDRRHLFRQFLNKECIWVPNEASTKHTKIFTCTTAVSPYWKMHGHMEPPGGGRNHFINITMMVMKPKNEKTCATFYVNGILLDCVTPEVIFTKKVPRPYNMCLIYFGDLMDPPMPTIIPAELRSFSSELSKNLTMLDLVNTSKSIRSSKDLPSAPRSIVPLGKGGAWMVNNNLIHFVVSPDMLMCCPGLPSFPSLTHIINLLTRCENEDCIPCHGAGIHVNVMDGVTEAKSTGKSHHCPCLMPCSARSSDYAPITGNHNLLSLLFDPQHHRNIVGLRFVSNSLTLNIQNIFVGVTLSGDEIMCRKEPWELLRVSALFSRLFIYNCQILKRKCLHSY